MRKTAVGWILAAGLVLSGSAAFFQDEAQDIETVYQKAMEARKNNNGPVYLENMLKATAALPDYPPLGLHLAAAQALNGKKAEALATLAEWAGRGLFLRAKDEEAFAPLRESSEFADLLRRFEQNLAPTDNSETVFELEDRTLCPESVAFDFRRFRFLVGSVRHGKIVQRDREADVSDFSSPEDGLGAVLGMKIDRKGEYLWACTAGIPQRSGLKEEDAGRTGAFQYDLDEGKLVGRFFLPEKGHLFGDLAIRPSGDIYASDSAKAAVYKLSPGGESAAWETVIDGAPLLNPQGLDFSPDGKLLYLADYLRGIYVLEPEVRRISLLAPPEDASFAGIDGLYFHRGTLIAVQNGVEPNRVIRIFLDASGKKAARVEVLEKNHRLFGEPTLGTVVKNVFYYVANSQWGAFDEKDGWAAEDTLKKPVILALKLK